MTIQTATSPFSWLRRARAPLDIMLSPATATAFDERMLQTDRTAAGEAMGAAIGSVLETVFDEVYSPEPDDDVHLMIAGTGTGKTSHTLASIASDPRTYAWDGREDQDDYPGPIVFLLPTYANINELRSRAEVLDINPSVSGTRLAAQARARGIIHVSEVEAYVAAMDGKKLRTEIWKGKKAAGCKRGPEVDALMAAGMPTSRLCRVTGKGGETFCPFYDSCGAIKQRDIVKHAHVVFAPRSFLDLRLPEEIEKVRLLIADEAVWPLLVHSTTFPLSTLDLVREEPRLSPDDDMSAAEMLGQRAAAVPVVKAALLAGTDPAQALRDHVINVPGMGAIPGLLTHSAGYAARITGAAMADRASINPWMSANTIIHLCALPTGAHIGDEHRFWSTIADQLENGVVGHDVRIQLLGKDTDEPMIRVAWLSTANWGDSPMLMLDASGDAEITARVFAGRQIIVHDVPVDLNMRTLACIDRRFAIRNIVPGPGASQQQLFDAAKLIHEIRCVISAICGVHGYGRVLIGMPKKMRKAIQLGWLPPTNADFLHSGAEAGLDFARQHVAVVSIGRLELPTAQIDAQVAALTADEEIPELPIDYLGTGVDDDGIGIYPHIVSRALRLRDGTDLLYQCHEHAGEMARRVQRQHREERILQLVGRLRAFYRTDTTACYIIGQAVPESLIIDEVCAWADLVGSGAAMWDVVRQAGGVLSPEMMHAADPSTATFERYAGWILRLPDSVLAGYHGVVGDMLEIGIPGHVQDIDAFVAATPRLRGQVQVISASTMTAPAAPEGRPDDDIEQRLGDRRQRRKAERAGIKKAKEIAQRRGEWRPGAGAFRAGLGELQTFRAPLGAWAAMATLLDPWIYGEEAVDATKTGAIAAG